MDHIAEHKFMMQLFDTQPNPVVWFVPEFTEGHPDPISDFKVAYCNTAASLILNVPKQQIIGSSLRSTGLIDNISRQTVSDQCLRIWGNGQSVEFTHFSTRKNKYFNVQASKVLNGILTITTDHTKFIREHQQREKQALLLNQIIETSTSGISVYEAIREQNGEIIDFKLKLANQKAGEITGFTLEQLYKYTVKELMVIRGQSIMFDTLVKVTNTREPVFMEFFSEARDKWIAFSIKKFEDGYLLNYIDITATKKLEQQARDQADLLTGILNASITGLITLKAVYDSSGRIEDFKFVLLNEAAEALLGISKDDQTKTYLTLFPKAKSNGFFDLYMHAMETGEPISKEFYYKGEGYNGWYYISLSKMSADTLVQSFADITHVRERSPDKR